MSLNIGVDRPQNIGRTGVANYVFGDFTSPSFVLSPRQGNRHLKFNLTHCHPVHEYLA